MHADELPIDDALVRRLVDGQFPQWRDLPLERVEPQGTDNAIFRLGDALAVRLPRRPGVEERSQRDELLARLAPQLPLEVPRVVARGAASHGYPWGWSVNTWLEGADGVAAAWDPLAAAEQLAAFVGALQRVEPAGVPLLFDRLADRGDDMRAEVAALGPRALAAWERALDAPPWAGPPILCHADLDARNWLVRDGRITGIIDWGMFGTCDPAADVMAAWKLHSSAARVAFREQLEVDDATWERARGWAIAQAASALGYYTLANNRPLVIEARVWLDEALNDGPVALVDYDPGWPGEYDRIAGLVRGALGARALVLEHAGSTSVPGLAAKPVVDVVLAVADPADEAAYLPALEEAGFFLRFREPDWHEHRLVRRNDADTNVHVFGAGSTEIERMVRFRDHLRTNDEDRRLYEHTKRELAGRSWADTQQYADAKSEVVEAILARAARVDRT
jgi:GrpB-like predicted nucleotidyltransferase (UPF0157 family)